MKTQQQNPLRTPRKQSPPALLKNIAENINKQLTSISSSKKVFDDMIPPYQKALESSYDHKLTYNPQPTCNRNRKRKVIWYNPPWNANMKTNLGRKFINIINRCFPNEPPTTQDLQQTHAKAELLQHA